MKWLVSILTSLILCTTGFGQTIEGDRILDLVGKHVAHPFFQQLKTQENFYTDAWDANFTIYINRSGDFITEVEFQNGKLRYGSTAERYGYYKKPLPLQLN